MENSLIKTIKSWVASLVLWSLRQTKDLEFVAIRDHDRMAMLVHVKLFKERVGTVEFSDEELAILPNKQYEK